MAKTSDEPQRPAFRPCPKCSTTGNCPVCNGAGEAKIGGKPVNCPGCNGSGNCDVCGGSGQTG